MGRVWIGTSGFSYPHWGRGVFYPKVLLPRDWLAYYSRYFDTVELNYTFYRLPTEETLNRWFQTTPPDFVFAIKGSRFITHLKRLKQPSASVRAFLERLSILQHKLGPVLFQLPPSMPLSVELLKDFLSFLRTQRIVPALSVVLEVRHPSWLVKEVFALLEQTHVALCLTDWFKLPVQEPLTAEFVYVRRHGINCVYSECYSPQMLQVDSRRILDWLSAQLDVYVYFNNDACGYAVQNAMQLKQLLKV